MIQMIQSQIITQTDTTVQKDAPEQHCIQHSFTNAQYHYCVYFCIHKVLILET